MKKLFLIFLVLFLIINCKQESKPSIIGNWYYMSNEVDDLLKIKPPIEVYFTLEKIYTIEGTYYPENRDYIISNDSIFLITPKKKTYNGLVTNLTKFSFTILTPSNTKVNFYKINEYLTIENLINEDCSIDEYYDSYYKRVEKIKNK